MSTVFKSSFAATAVLCLLFAASAAHGAESPASPAPPNLFDAKAVDPQALARQRGGSDAASASDVKLSGTVTNNNASNLTTGSNIITDGALAGASGVPMIIQNSGNNVLIQSATIINVTVK